MSRPALLPPLLQVRKLNISYGRRSQPAVRVVRDLSLHVDRGETLAIVGESGCGKSTTALALMRLLPETASVQAEEFSLDGQDVLGLPEQAMRKWRGARISMVFQDALSALNPVRTVGRQIAEVLRNHGASAAEARQRTLALLDRVRIPEAARRADEYPHHLSGGMRQRVMIAMALAGNPQLLIADEPTTALDVTVQAQILRLLHDLQQETGMGLILITHDLGVVAEIADRVTVMYAGEGVEERQVDGIFQTPAHPYTRSLLRARPTPGIAQERLLEIPGSVGTGTGGSGCLFADRCAWRQTDCHDHRPAASALADGWFKCSHPQEIA